MPFNTLLGNAYFSGSNIQQQLMNQQAQTTAYGWQWSQAGAQSTNGWQQSQLAQLAQQATPDRKYLKLRCEEGEFLLYPRHYEDSLVVFLSKDQVIPEAVIDGAFYFGDWNKQNELQQLAGIVKPALYACYRLQSEEHVLMARVSCGFLNKEDLTPYRG